MINFAGFDAFVIFQILFYLAVLIFVIHAAVFAYHWLTFGADKKKSLTGVAIHLAVGSVLLIIMAITLFTM